MLFCGQKPTTPANNKKRSFLTVPQTFLLRSPRRGPKVRKKAYRCASLTVECALVLPLFLMAVLTMLSVIDLCGAVSRQSLALSNEARKTAAYRALAGGEALSWIDLHRTVSPELSFSALPVIHVRAEIRARVRSWTGFNADDFAGVEESQGENSSILYISDYESVYHTHPDCTHLDLTIYETDTDTVGSLRNIYGSRYKKCDGFPAGYKGRVYVTPKGDRYYPSPQYGSLNRHVHIISAEDANGLPQCSRCRERDHAS